MEISETDETKLVQILIWPIVKYKPTIYCMQRDVTCLQFSAPLLFPATRHDGEDLPGSHRWDSSVLLCQL